MKKDYKMLAQSERDPEGYVVKPESKSPRRSCLLGLCIVLVLIVLLVGAISLVAGLFYSKEVSSALSSWKGQPKEPETGNGTAATALKVNGTGPGPTEGPGLNLTDSAEVGNGTSGELASAEYEDSEEEEEEEEEVMTTTTTTVKPAGHGKKPPKHRGGTHNDTRNDTASGSIKDQMLDQTSAVMIRVEKFLENTTGIQRAELLIPLFMFLCFVVSLSLACCCCYLMMKRRETQRRRVLGKIITDLQTGDSKAVLLGQDVDD